MKYVVCIPDGCADLPVKELGGKTPLEAASTPVLDELARRGKLGQAKVIPDGLPPGSDVGIMSIFGYDPAQHHTGRAPIEAAAMGIELNPDQSAFRCNLVKVNSQGGSNAGAEGETMLDFAGGHPDNDIAAKAISALNAELGSTGADKSNGSGGGITFYPGVQYRHIMVAPKELVGAVCTPPHDISDQPLVWPTGKGSEQLKSLMLKSREILADIDGLSANQIWLWGQGVRPEMQVYEEKYGKKAGLVTAVDLVRGLGILTRMEVVEVPGATAWYDTNYEGKRDAVLAGLEAGADIFILHIEASDEAGHAGNTKEKVKCLENWDSRVLKDLIPGLNEMGSWRMLIMPDHATPLELKTHTSDPVPYLLLDSEDVKNGTKGQNGALQREGIYSEAYVSGLEQVPAHQLMQELLAV